MDHQQHSWLLAALMAQTVESVAAMSGGREMRPHATSERPVGGLSRIVCSFSSTYRLLQRVVVVRDCDEVRIYFEFFKTEIRILNDDEFNIPNCWYGEMKHDIYCPWMKHRRMPAVD